jgi:glutamine synthetase type III
MNNLDLFLQLLKNVTSNPDKAESIYIDVFSQLARWVQHLENQQLLDKQDIVDKINKLEEELNSTLSKLTSSFDKIYLILNGYSDKDKENGIINKMSSIENSVEKLKYFKIQIITGVTVINGFLLYLFSLFK